METSPDGTHQYVLADQVGPFRSVQITLNTGTGFFTGSVGLAGGVTAVPEPATLAFVGTTGGHRSTAPKKIYFFVKWAVPCPPTRLRFLNVAPIETNSSQ